MLRMLNGARITENPSMTLRSMILQEKSCFGHRGFEPASFYLYVWFRCRAGQFSKSRICPIGLVSPPLCVGLHLPQAARQPGKKPSTCLNHLELSLFNTSA